MSADTAMLSVRSVLQSPGLYSIWMSGSNGRSVGTNVMPKSCERNSLKPPISETSPVSITWNQTQTGAIREDPSYSPTVELYKISRCVYFYRDQTSNTHHLARVVGTDGDAKISLDEGVVDQVSHIFERLPIVFTDTVTKLQLEPQTTVMTNNLLLHFYLVKH